MYLNINLDMALLTIISGQEGLQWLEASIVSTYMRLPRHY